MDSATGPLPARVDVQQSQERQEAQRPSREAGWVRDGEDGADGRRQAAISRSAAKLLRPMNPLIEAVEPWLLPRGHLDEEPPKK